MYVWKMKKKDEKPTISTRALEPVLGILLSLSPHVTGKMLYCRNLLKRPQKEALQRHKSRNWKAIQHLLGRQASSQNVRYIEGVRMASGSPLVQRFFVI